MSVLSHASSQRFERRFRGMHALGFALSLTLLGGTGCSSFLADLSPEADPAPEADPEPGNVEPDTPNPEQPNPDQPTPEGEPGVVPEPQPGVEPDGEPSGQPEGEPAGQPDGEPEGEPSGQPDGEPEGEPAGQPDGEPDGEPDGTPEPQPEPQGELILSPDDVQFEGIAIRSGSRKTLVLENNTDAPVEVNELGLRASSQAFIVEPLSLPFTIESQGSFTFDVYFRPLAGAGSQYQNFIDIRTRDNREFEARLRGEPVVFNPESCLRFADSTMRVTGPGNGGAAQNVMLNCGSTPMDISEFDLLGSDAFEATIDSGSDVLAPGQVATVTVRFVGGQSTDETRSALGVVSGADGDPGSFAVAQITSGPGCPSVSASAESPLEATVGEVAAGLSGDEFQISGEATAAINPFLEVPLVWSDRNPNNGSGTFSAPTTEGENTYTPIGGGLHELTVRPTRDNGAVIEACPSATVTLDVFPATPTMEVELSWVGVDDLDLHLLQSDENTNFGEFFTDDDCFYNAQYQRNFGATDFLFDGAYLVDDVTDGSESERIRLAAFEDGRAYKVGVTQNANANVSTDVEVTVRIGADEETLSVTFEANNAAIWIPFTIENGQVQVSNTFEGG